MGHSRRSWHLRVMSAQGVISEMLVAPFCRLKPASVSRAQLDRTALQRDQAMSAGGDPIRQANYLAFIKLGAIRIWLHANEFAPWWARFRASLRATGVQSASPACKRRWKNARRANQFAFQLWRV
jgi:hypothetical protein